ncbi:MAG: hypothetical protein JXA41_02975 [Deltaproteobacteria bacterium]|nr:hypothetical protein [Deltaproteobacteria bacterium]
MTNKNTQTVRILAIRSLTDTAVGLSAAADNALRSIGQDASEIRAVLSDRVVAYALVAERNGHIRFHTNPHLVHTKLSDQEVERWIRSGTVTNRRIVLGTGVPAYEFNFIMYRPQGPPEMLRLVLHTTAVDQTIKQAERIWWITGPMIALLWIMGILFERFFTYRFRLHTELENQRRLSLIGQMTATLAHEIRNALGSVKGYAQWLEKKAETPGPQKDALDAIVKGALRIELLVQELLLYSKEELYHLESFEAAPLIQEAVIAAAADWPGNIQLDIDPRTTIRADREKLYRVMVNGIKNALDAMGQSGHLAISSDHSSRRVIIRIEDTGTGLSDQDNDRLFMPFYTTKTDGTGLGLAYAKKVVEGMAGSIQLTNRAGGRGAVLTIALPKGKVK